MSKQCIAAVLPVAALLAACGGRVVEGPQPVLTIVGRTGLDFGQTVLAGTSLARDVTLENRASDGADVRPLENIVIGVNGAGLSVEHDCPSTLAAGSSCTIRVAAQPQQAGVLGGTLVVSSNAEGSPLTLAASGSAVGALPASAFGWATGSSGSVGPVTAGATEPLEINITNFGDQPGVLTSVELLDAGESWKLALDPACPDIVKPNETCLVTVNFKPAAAGAYAARLEFTDSYHAGFAAPRLALTGTAVAASAATR